MTSKKFFLDQHGCAKNQVDGELIIDRLEKKGYIRTTEAEEADLIIVNSCGFIESAKKESLDAVMTARSSYPHAKILLSGCLAERYAKDLKDALPEADGIFGNGDISEIDNIVSSLFKGERPVLTPQQKGVCCGDRNTMLSFPGSAFVKITEGCNNCCSFCAIPLIRGKLRSRKAEDIVDEISSLVKKGYKEICLIGQDLAAYGCGKEDDVFGEGTNGYEKIYRNLEKPLFEYSSDSPLRKEKSYLARLAEKISSIEGNFWIRLLYIHPDHFDPDLLEVMKKDSRILPYFDIPFQSASEKIVHAMNRKGSSESYIKLEKIIRSAFPDAAIRTTFLTGFPGESEDDASKTFEFLSSLNSDWSGCFTYSCEEDTPAAKMKGKVSSKTAQKRADLLLQKQSEITCNRLSKRTGKKYDVLVEEIIQNNEGTDEGLAIGRAWFQAPEVDGNVVIRYDLSDPKAKETIVPGNMVSVMAASSSEFDIDGVFLDQ